MANWYMKRFNHQGNANQNPNEVHLTTLIVIKKGRTYECWQVCGVKGGTVWCWWDCTLEQPVQETVQRFLKK